MHHLNIFKNILKHFEEVSTQWIGRYGFVQKWYIYIHSSFTRKITAWQAIEFQGHPIIQTNPYWRNASELFSGTPIAGRVGLQYESLLVWRDTHASWDIWKSGSGNWSGCTEASHRCGSQETKRWVPVWACCRTRQDNVSGTCEVTWSPVESGFLVFGMPSSRTLYEFIGFL